MVNEWMCELLCVPFIFAVLFYLCMIYMIILFPISLQSLKTRTYWLPPTLKLITGSSQVLRDTIDQHLSLAEGHSRQCWLYAWVSVSAAVREILSVSCVQQQPKRCRRFFFFNLFPRFFPVMHFHPAPCSWNSCPEKLFINVKFYVLLS